MGEYILAGLCESIITHGKRFNSDIYCVKSKKKIIIIIFKCPDAIQIILHLTFTTGHAQ